MKGIHMAPLNIARLHFSILAFALTTNIYAQSQDNEVEVIEVKGQRTIFFLEKQIDKTRIDFYELFNTYNTEKKFDVICKYQKRVGSNIADKVCEPRFLKDTRARLFLERAASGIAIDLGKLPSERDIQMAAKQDQEASLVHMQELIVNNPELREKYLELHSLVAKYNKRTESKD